MMFGIRRHLNETTPAKQVEMLRPPVIPASTAAAQENTNGRAWRWQVEPGMEGAFQDLLGWMLPGQQGAEVETADSPPQASAPVAAEHRPQPTVRVAGARHPTSELEPLAA